MQMKSTVNEKWEIMLPRTIMKRLKIKPKTSVIFEIKNGELTLTPDK